LTGQHLCVTMSNMKTTTVREVQHNLSKILRWIEEGEVVTVTRHKRVVANIVPSVPKPGPPDWPDFTKRLRAIWGNAPTGKPASRIIIDQRSERP
jgi:antitoxin (DNA-binding transcriptional repressor) of toxin-antitoxin stability system